eukprot:TRINITY_DN582_c0_g1_i2.p1 TRINITY_DN582_c0_g1~~TRINITY_DN582_c0_g1_i2.p1  ORF type:complete len:313 (+),score=33.08 TRINITY_DN582_c0_g1_i2:185-1123(+)
MGLTATRIIGRPRTDITDELVCDYDVMKAKLSAMSDENKRKLGLSLVRPKSEIQLKALELINVKLMVDQFYINFRKPKEVPVKLILTDPPGDWGRIRRRIAARIGKILFHGLHAALQIGSTLVDWGSQSLTYPRDVSSSAAIIAIEIGVLRVDDAETCCHKLCTLMAKWNVWETYNLKTRNCQHFVDEALLNLNLPLPTNGVIGFLSLVSLPIFCFTSTHLLLLLNSTSVAEDKTGKVRQRSPGSRFDRPQLRFRNAVRVPRATGQLCPQATGEAVSRHQLEPRPRHGSVQTRTPRPSRSVEGIRQSVQTDR